MFAIALVILRRAQALRGTIRLRESDMRLTGSPFTAYFVMSPSESSSRSVDEGSLTPASLPFRMTYSAWVSMTQVLLSVSQVLHTIRIENQR